MLYKRQTEPGSESVMYIIWKLSCPDVHFRTFFCS